jgi:abortive infection bacteriophage resistance protein
MPRPFDKSPKTYRQQIEILRQRGMQVNDNKAAEFYLKHLNYYRLAAYWLPFEADHATHVFRPGTSFEQVLNLYVFDRELRLLILDAIERIEVSVRAHWAYELSHRHGPHAHLNNRLVRNRCHYRKNMEKLENEVSRAESSEVFIRHFQNTYGEELPPVWAACEVMSLGLLSRWYRNLKPAGTRVAIAKPYKIGEQILESWLHHLSTMRNTCAHHSRVWNREFTVVPTIPDPAPGNLRGQFVVPSRKIYNSLVIMLHLMDIVAPNHHWRKRLLMLIDLHDIDISRMGFPEEWITFPIWKERDK